MKHVVKRQGHTEEYDSRKLYASVYAACLSVRATTGEAELVAEKVVAHVDDWLKNKHEVTAHDIRRIAAKHFRPYNANAAYMYLNHREWHR
ncbi:MAG TPA: ATP cone domain-containing protein [Candidatus Saccharimonadales bacterium]